MIEEILRQASVEDKKVFIHYRKGNGELSERVIGTRHRDSPCFDIAGV